MSTTIAVKDKYPLKALSGAFSRTELKMGIL